MERLTADTAALGTAWAVGPHHDWIMTNSSYFHTWWKSGDMWCQWHDIGSGIHPSITSSRHELLNSLHVRCGMCSQRQEAVQTAPLCLFLCPLLLFSFLFCVSSPPPLPINGESQTTATKQAHTAPRTVGLISSSLTLLSPRPPRALSHRFSPLFRPAVD